MKTILPPSAPGERIAFGDSRLLDRIWAKVHLNPETGCWEWTGKTNERGYGYIQIGRQSCRAHRVAYEALVGPIPEGLVLDHLCRVRPCMNPEHLEPVTHGENTRRGAINVGRKGMPLKGYKSRPNCRNGHPYTEASSYFRASGKRVCRVCARIRKQRYQLEARRSKMHAAIEGGAR